MKAGNFIRLIGAVAICIIVMGAVGAAWAQAPVYWTGDGGKGKSITILAPEASGLPEKLDYLPALVQGELVSNFTSFSAISVLDRVNLEKQYLELFSEFYSDDATAKSDLGHLAPTDFIMGGSITRTPTGYALQLRITKTADKMTVASYSGTTTFNELNNLTGVRRAALDLLPKMGVMPTEQAQTALAGAAAANHVSAQTALAQGIVAQRKGTEVAALSYFYQAAAFDPALTEATNRSVIIAANISSGNIGADVRNDIVWRQSWIAKLAETEDAFYEIIKNAAPPYTLHYSTGIETKKINYQNETANLSVSVNLIANREWFTAMDQSLQTAHMVLGGLNGTNRVNDWGLGRWPWTGVTNTNPFGRHRQHDFAIDFELLDQSGNVIGKQTVSRNLSFRITTNRNKQIIVEYTENTPIELVFNAVRANDISDDLTVRIASVNKKPPELARFAIIAISPEQRQQNIFLRIEKGVVKGFNSSLTKEQKAQYRDLVIPSEAWGEPVIAIGDGAFRNSGLTSVTIPNTVTTIGKNAFRENEIKTLDLGSGVTFIGDEAFAGKAFAGDRGRGNSNGTITQITIGENVKMEKFVFGVDQSGYQRFVMYYRSREINMSAGTYHRAIGSMTSWVLGDEQAVKSAIKKGKQMKWIGGGVIVLLLVLIGIANEAKEN